MAFQFDSTTRTSWASDLAAALAGGTLKFFSGALPANCAAADPSGTLCTITLPSPCLIAAAGAVSKAGTWSANASSSGTALCARGYDSGATCRIQGNVNTDFVLNNTGLTSGQPVTVTAINIVFPGA